ncbi:hypothetical protein E3J74_04040 [Candidatus Bathyarchaeota archaeon]|nr:MAG: hypothetical protein E3J74_04040 [Candidatus Bathyarchaeota archaeon]
MHVCTKILISRDLNPPDLNRRSMFVLFLSKSLISTQIYIHLEEKLFQQLNNEFIVRRAVSIKGMMTLATVGFEKFDQVDDVHLYRKPKGSEEL